MNSIRQLNDSLEFIENNLTNNITGKDVAKHVHFSYHHFIRTFHIISGVTVSEYIRNRRLTLAANDIISSNEKIIDIAFKYQYTTPEAFTKAFKRFHGVTPLEARKTKKDLVNYSKISFVIDVKGSTYTDYRVTDIDDLVFSGFTKIMPNGQGPYIEDIPVFWNQLAQEKKHLILHKYNETEELIGISYDYDEDSKTFKYFVGIRGEYDDPEFEVIKFKKNTFASFKAKGPLPEAIQGTIQHVFTEWLPSSNYELAIGPEIEVYPNGDKLNENYSSFYYIPIKK